MANLFSSDPDQQKRRPGEESEPPGLHGVAGLESKLSANLEGAGGSVCSEKRAEDAGGRRDRSDAVSELRVVDVANGLIEVGMVEDVEGLSADLELRGFPLGNAKALHDGEIGIEIIGP